MMIQLMISQCSEVMSGWVTGAPLIDFGNSTQNCNLKNTQAICVFLTRFMLGTLRASGCQHICQASLILSCEVFKILGSF